jgi:hypothetical protein
MSEIESKNLNNIHQQYFKLNNCTDLMLIRNQMSKIDAIIISADTNILIEYKRRGSILEYDSMMIDRSKITSMQNLSVELDSPAFLVIEYDEVILMYLIDNNKQYKFDVMPCPSTSHFNNNDTVLKESIFFNFGDAEYIISKKTWKRGTAKQLIDYINFKKYGI